MHLLARIVPASETTDEMRAVGCLQCGEGLLLAMNIPDEDARALAANHYATDNPKHDIVIHSKGDIVFVRADAHGYAREYPDSLLAVLRNA
jgi:hypothetical protein